MGLRQSGYLTFHQQVILEYLVSTQDDVITEGTDSIILGCRVKGIETKRVTLMPGKKNQNANRGQLVEASNWIKGPFRTYLRGHGDWQMMTLGGRKAVEVSGDVGVLGNFDQCKLISITGCQLALSPLTNGSGTGTNSFAKEFHSLLSARGTMDMTKDIPVFARTATVQVANMQLVDNLMKLQELGEKVTLRTVGSKNSKDSKKVFFWRGGTQMMADATLSNSSDIVLGLSDFDVFGTPA